MLCAARFLGPKRDVTQHLDRIVQDMRGTQIVFLDGNDSVQYKEGEMTSYDTLIAQGRSSQLSDSDLSSEQLRIQPGDTLNLQFTSGKRQSASLRFERFEAERFRYHGCSKSGDAFARVSPS